MRRMARSWSLTLGTHAPAYTLAVCGQQAGIFLRRSVRKIHAESGDGRAPGVLTPRENRDEPGI